MRTLLVVAIAVENKETKKKTKTKKKNLKSKIIINQFRVQVENDETVNESDFENYV